MKMSKSIKDYKDAMDNIKISDSFYKRTEILLTELPEIELDKKPVMTSRSLTTAVSAIAACFLLVFGIKFIADRRESTITTETEITQVEIETTLETAPVLVDTVEEEDDSLVEAAGAEPDTADGGNHASDAEIDTTAEKVNNELAINESVQETKPSETTAERKPTKSTTTVTIEKAGYPTVHETKGAEDIPLLSDISYEYVTVEITPYFNMNNIKSGEGAVKGKGTEYKELISYIAEISSESTKINNSSFTSIFSVQVADENIGLTFYSIYVTDNGALVITKHDLDGQKRYTYAMKPDDFEYLKRLLFRQFGSEEEYELFSNLISGK